MARMRRKFADVRKAAADKKAAATRDDYKRTYSQNLGKRKFGKTDTSQSRGLKGDLAQLNRDASQLPVLKELNQMRDDFGGVAKKGIERFIDFLPKGKKEKFAGIPHWFAQNMGRNFEEVEAAKRDDDEFTWGGDPIAVDKGSPAYQFLLNQMEDKDAFRDAVGDDEVFYTGLEEMSGNKYDASHPGLIALLNDPSRIKDMAPIRALNYMRSITGDPSNMGFDEFEALRQSQPDTYGGLDATGIAKKLLPEYYSQANKMYGQGFIGDTAAANYGNTAEINPAIMNYQDPIRDMVPQQATGQSILPYQDASAEDVSISDIEEYNKNIGIDPDPGWWSYPVGMDQRPNTTSHWLQGIYPNYTPNPILNELEDMNEQELLDWGAQNPNEAEVLGFNPYYSNRWLD